MNEVKMNDSENDYEIWKPLAEGLQDGQRTNKSWCKQD